MPSIRANVYLIVFTISDIRCQISIPPKNNADTVGSTVTLDCYVPTEVSSAVQWFQYRSLEDTTPKTISFGDTIVNPSFTNYSIITGAIGGNTFFNLRITNLQLSNGARYACHNAANNQRAFLYLVDLASDPVCTSNATLSDLVEGEYVKLTCSVGYSLQGTPQEQETWAPTMSWTGPNVPPAIDESIIGSTSQYSVIIPLTPAQNGASYSCITGFNSLPPKADHASNAPAYTYSWMSDLFNVQYAPMYVQISPGGPEYSPGQIITCSATANPSPRYTWINLADNTTISGPEYTVPQYNEGGSNNYQIVCRASNVIRSETYSTESQTLNFAVVTTTTTSTSTEYDLYTTLSSPSPANATTTTINVPVTDISTSTTHPSPATDSDNSFVYGLLAGMVLGILIASAFIFLIQAWIRYNRNRKSKTSANATTDEEGSCGLRQNSTVHKATTISTGTDLYFGDDGYETLSARKEHHNNPSNSEKQESAYQSLN